MTEAAHLAPGTIVGGDYRIVRRIAVGGMGAVYEVEQLSTGRSRALKVMLPQLISDARSRERFVAEARISSRIQSQHVVEVIGAGVDAQLGVPWLAMELLRGETLDHLVQREGPLPLATVVELLGQLGHALSEGHDLGIVHRDLKPENLFLAESRTQGARHTLKILDFGIASMVASGREAATVTSALGTPFWMAPEQANAGHQLTPSADVWALGLIAYYMLTGKIYWRSANMPE
ncbi:MAG: serine/threonine protein kinase, partial [Sandaracinaceae bacterium]|nr:serine/threonine protein kinase [Sandaracinaceae bacterium]